MKLNEGAFFAVLVICFTILVLVTISLGHWNTNQVRMTYQTAYQNNMECRSEVAKNGNLNGLQYVDRTCGTIPQFEDYQK